MAWFSDCIQFHREAVCFVFEAVVYDCRLVAVNCCLVVFKHEEPICMRSVVSLLAVGILAAAVCVPRAAAQGVEINPYFGGVFPGSSSVGELKTNALWGVRAGVHLDPS